jgi:hypothetical protein
MTELPDRDEVKRIADRDDTVEGVVADRTGLEKPVTRSGWADPNDRFCELCTYAQTASFRAPSYGPGDGQGTVVCTTHARALVTGDWDYGTKYEVVPISEER